MTERLIKQTKMINLSSKTATKYNNNDKSFLSDLSFTIPNLISMIQDVNDVYISVEHCEIPNSFYLINEYNNILAVNGSIYFIPYGNYNRNTLVTAITNLLGSNYSMTYDKSTFKFTMTNSVSEFSISSTSSSCRTILGLSDTGILYSVNKTLAFPFPMNVTPLPRLEIKCPNIGLNNYQSSDGSCDVLLSLQNNSEFGQMITYDNSSNMSFYMTDVSQLNELTFKITDDSGQLINFNNIHWYITIRFDFSFYVSKTTDTFDSVIQRNYKKWVDNLEL